MVTISLDRPNAGATRRAIAGLTRWCALLAGIVPALHGCGLQLVPFPQHHASCLFGGATADEEMVCARKNFGAGGAEAIVRHVNEEVLDRNRGQALACKEHVAQFRQALRPYRELEVADLVSCDAPGQCHVSALVTDRRTGQQFVADNGHVFEPETTGGVGTFAEFEEEVRSSHRLGPP